MSSSTYRNSAIHDACGWITSDLKTTTFLLSIDDSISLFDGPEIIKIENILDISYKLSITWIWPYFPKVKLSYYK